MTNGMRVSGQQLTPPNEQNQRFFLLSNDTVSSKKNRSEFGMRPHHTILNLRTRCCGIIKVDQVAITIHFVDVDAERSFSRICQYLSKIICSIRIFQATKLIEIN